MDGGFVGIELENTADSWKNSSYKLNSPSATCNFASISSAAVQTVWLRRPDSEYHLSRVECQLGLRGARIPRDSWARGGVAEGEIKKIENRREKGVVFRGFLCTPWPRR